MIKGQIKNIIIFVAILAGLFLVYFFLGRSKEEEALVPVSLGSTPGNLDGGSATLASPRGVASDFLAILLGIRSIQLNDSIFSSPAFRALTDSSIELVSDGTEGRENPFAPINSAPPQTPGTPPMGGSR